MPLSNQYERLPLDQIKINREGRQRKDLDIKEGFIASLKQNGVINPIVIDRGRNLIAGERRLEGSKQAGLPDIPIRYLDSLDPIEQQIIELEENIKRTDLEWLDQARAIGRIHGLYRERDPDWTGGETADAIGLTQGTLSIYLKVFNEIEDERVQKAATLREAYNILGRRDNRANAQALEELLDVTNDVAPLTPSPEGHQLANGSLPRVNGSALPQAPVATAPEHCVLHESFLKWAPKYTGRKFNLIHCDFPYGVNAFAGGQVGSEATYEQYDDGKGIYFELLSCLCSNIDRLMGVSGHMMFWYSMVHHTETLEIFRRLAPSLDVQPHPLIWVKSDNAGIVSDVKRRPRHIYETCLLASRGGRQIVEVKSDAYSAPTDKRLHVSAKPQPMLEHFMRMLVDHNTALLDPTCGAGSSLRAAEALGASRVLGMDIDERHVGVARVELRKDRMLRSASKGI